MTEASYLDWGGESLGFHFGLADEHTASRNESLVNMNRFLADQARIVPDTKVLDAGCGVGGSSIWLASERRATVVGITITPRQVELAQRYAREHGVADRTAFLCMDFAATTFAESSFDVVWNLESVSHANDVRGYLDHVHDLLRVSGHFVCADLFLGNGGDPEHARAMCDGWVLPNLRAREEVAADLQAAGFRDVESLDLTPRVLRSAQAMRSVASMKKLELSLGRTLTGAPENAVHVRHLDAALAAVAGLESGAVTYGYVGGHRG